MEGDLEVVAEVRRAPRRRALASMARAPHHEAEFEGASTQALAGDGNREPVHVQHHLRQLAPVVAPARADPVLVLHGPPLLPAASSSCMIKNDIDGTTAVSPAVKGEWRVVHWH